MERESSSSSKAEVMTMVVGRGIRMESPSRCLKGSQPDGPESEGEIV
jgi:hypothetical protein